MSADPYGTATGSGTFTFYQVPADTSGTISIGGSPVTVATTTPGQNGSLTFAGTAGKNIHLTASNVTISLSQVSILNPDGSTLTSGYILTTGGTLSATLGTTGTYKVVIDPNGAAAGSMTLTLTDPPAQPAHAQAARLGTRPRHAGTAAARIEAAARARRLAFLDRAGEGAASAGKPATVPLPRFRTTRSARWAPAGRNFRGNWTTGQVTSPWTHLPPRPAPPGTTAVAGQVLRLNGLPLAGVQITVQGTSRSARTDATGRFVLTGLHAGHRVLAVNAPGTGEASTTYGTFQVGVNVQNDARTSCRSPSGSPDSTPPAPSRSPPRSATISP